MDEQNPAARLPSAAKGPAGSDGPQRGGPGPETASTRNPDGEAAGSLRSRRFDPNRRDRIIDAVLEVVADNGVAGTSFRKIAAQADVPLGSMTYHFSGMQELLATGFERFIIQSLARLEDRLRPARDHHDAVEVVLTIIHEDATADPPRHLAVSRELQALVIREPAFRGIANEWVEGSAKILKRYFDPLTAEILEILMDGLTLRRGIVSMGAETLAADTVARVIPESRTSSP